MKLSIHTIPLVFALTTAIAPLAHAGGSRASVEGPFKDASYAVRTANCGAASWLSVTATAEGVVNGQRRSMPIKLSTTKEKGVYRFTRTWPSEGQWMVRVQVRDGHGPVTLASIASDGHVGENEYLWDTDGRHECDQKLAANTKSPN
jgi:hypothetical protein